MDFYEYGYYGPEAEEFMEFLSEFGLAFLGVAVVVLLAVLAVCLVLYVLQSIGIYAIAKRRGIHHPWLAWLPIGNYWIVGCISDQYQYVVKERVRNKRKVLLTLSIVSLAVNLALQVAGNAALLTLFMDGSQDGVLASGAISLVSSLICSGMNIATLVFYYMALYDLYTSCHPQNNVLYLVFSIIFRVTEPFFLFCNRHRDLGMPPRREAPQSYIPEEPAPQETWTSPEEL